MGKRKIQKSEYDKIKELYLGERKTMPEIARFYEVGNSTIWAILNKMNIPVRSKSEIVKLRWTNKNYRLNQINKRKGKTSGSKGKKWKSKRKYNHKKEKNPNWQGGRTKLSFLIRALPEYVFWRMGVFKRDNFVCVICNRKREKGTFKKNKRKRQGNK